MNASALISEDFIPLRTSTLGSEALEMMHEFHLSHLPIVNDKDLLGMIAEEDILDNDPNEAVGSYPLRLPMVFVFENDHVFDVMGQMSRHQLSAIPVVDHQEGYLGFIRQQDIIRSFGSEFAFNEPGGILVLQMSKPDYTLSEIARIVESEQATILSTFISEDSLSNQIRVHLKLNKPDLQRIVSALERFEYDVQAMYTLNDSDEIYKDRYESFMHYLGM